MDQATLLTEVQRRTGVRLSSTDPVLAAAVINEVMLEATLDEIQKLVRGVGGQLDAALVQAGASAKASATKVIMDASAWLEVRFKETAQDATASILADIRTELHQVEKTARTARKAAWIAGFGGVVSTAVAIGLLAGLI